MTTKSIALPHSYIRLTVLFNFTFLLISVKDASVRQVSYNYKEMEIIDDLPVEDNMEKYLSSLESAVCFVDGHRFFMDWNLYFGLHLVNANLKHVMQNKGHFLSVKTVARLQHLEKTIDDIMEHFAVMQRNDEKNVFALLMNVYNDETVSAKSFKKFNLDLLKKTKFYSRKYLEVVYFKWPEYLKGATDFDHGRPTAQESDACLEAIAMNPVNYNARMSVCHVPYNCIEVTRNGSNYGYALTHRLFILLESQYWRNCVTVSVKEDNALIDNICATIYNEAEYIAYHDFELSDLIMEQMVLCSLEGHAQFLRRSWMDELLDFQTVYGCFNTTRPTEKHSKSTRKVSKEFIKLDDIERFCSPHVTGVGAAMLSSALAYIFNSINVH